MKGVLYFINADVPGPKADKVRTTVALASELLDYVRTYILTGRLCVPDSVDPVHEWSAGVDISTSMARGASKTIASGL